MLYQLRQSPSQASSAANRLNVKRVNVYLLKRPLGVGMGLIVVDSCYSDS